MALVYGIRAKNSDQYFYVGCTIKTAHERMMQHIEQVRYGLHVNRHFANKVKKIGIGNVTVDVLETTIDGEQFTCEKWWIEHLLERGVKLTNLVHNGKKPYRSKSGASKYSLRNNWYWAREWYENYQRGDVLIADRPENEQLIVEAQRVLADAMAEILSAPMEKRQALIEHFE